MAELICPLAARRCYLIKSTLPDGLFLKQLRVTTSTKKGVIERNVKLLQQFLYKEKLFFLFGV
jgi:hypothetical protein